MRITWIVSSKGLSSHDMKLGTVKFMVLHHTSHN